MRKLVQEQMKQDANGPVLLWGPYLWVSGATPRKADGFTYTQQDVVGDGTHPSASGSDKVAGLLLEFFTKDRNAVPWFVKKDVATK